MGGERKRQTVANKREAIFTRFDKANEQWRRLLKLAMSDAGDAPKGVLSSWEKVVLSQTGSTNELVKYETLNDRLQTKKGQPLLAIEPHSRGGVIGEIASSLEGDSSTSRGTLYVILRNACPWQSSPEGAIDAPVPHRIILLATIEYQEESLGFIPTHERPINYTISEPYKNGVLLIGNEEIFSRAGKEAEGYIPLLAGYYKRFYEPQ